MIVTKVVHGNMYNKNQVKFAVNSLIVFIFL